MKQIEFIFTTTKVKFNLVDDIISNIWFDMMKKKRQIDTLTPQITMDADFPAFRNVAETHRTILDLVNELKNYNFYFEWPVDFGSITNEELNRLHQSFHEQEEFFKDKLPDRVHEIMGLINQGVHQMEQIFWSKEENERVNYAVLDFGSSEKEIEVQTALTPELREHFCEKVHDNQNKVSLLLGYNTLGKNLSHCVYTNDPKVVIDGMVRPQNFIFTQVLFRYTVNWVPYTHDSSNKHNNAIWETQEKWVMNNNLTDYIDPSLPENKFCTSPVLAYIDEDYLYLGEDDWYNIWFNEKFLNVKLYE